MREDFKGVAEELANFTSTHRRGVWFLEESYYRGRYGYVEYTEDDGRECIDTAEKLISLLRMVEGLSQEVEDRYMVRRFRRLMSWRRYAGSVAKAAKEVLGPDTQVYMVGGAAEGRLTALSDIDFVLVTPNAP